MTVRGHRSKLIDAKTDGELFTARLSHYSGDGQIAQQTPGGRENEVNRFASPDLVFGRWILACVHGARCRANEERGDASH
jgi:hypothetical protein